MANIFNEYGNIPHEFPLNELERTIEDTAKDYIDKATAMGASVVELRALASHLTGIIDVSFSEDRLGKQIAMKKAEREKATKKFRFHCQSCGRSWFIKSRFVSAEDNIGTDCTCHSWVEGFEVPTCFYACPECEHQWEKEERLGASETHYCDCPHCGTRDVSPYKIR